MKKIILLFSLCCLLVGNIFGQCTNTTAFGSATIPTTNAVVTISTVSFAGEYSTVSGAVAGTVIQFTSSVATDYITVHAGTFNGPVIAQGPTPLSFPNTFTGTIFPHWNTSALCGSQATSRTTTVQCVSCAPPPNPCNTIGAAVCNVNQTVTLTGGGAGWNVTSCGFSTPGAEQVYAFTAPFTGTYTLNVTGGVGGFIDWFFKPTSAGCGPTGWTCIDDVSTSATVSFSLTAGTYYILADAEGTTTRSQTFNIGCVQPVDPCNTILPAVCGVPQTVTLTGAGSWNVTSCGFTTPGNEQVYSFTAPTTGTYILNVTAGVGGFLDYFFKPTSAGCGPTGWTCIDDISTSGTVAFTLTAGTYFILVDDETTAATTQTWSITCPQPAPANDLCANAEPIACGDTKTGNTTFATPDLAPSCNGFTVGTGGGVWYTFVGNGGFVTLSMCDPGTTYDSKLHVYEGTCTTPICVTADDDGCTSPALASTVTFCTVSGTTYYVLVNGFLAASGPFVLTMDCTPPTVTIDPVGPFCVDDAPVTLTASQPGGTFSGPGVTGNTFDPGAAGPGTHTITYTVCNVTATTTITVFATPANDLVENAEPMACGTSVTGNTTCATSETLGVCGTTDGTGGGVWYVMPGTGNQISLETCNSVTDYDTKIRVYSGSPSALTCVTGNDDDPTCTTGPGVAGFKSFVTWCSSPGVDYYILVHGFGSAEGNFMLESTCAPVAPTIVCAPAPVTQNLDSSCCATVADYTGLTTATDDCGPVTITQSPAPGSTLCGPGTYTITFTATDPGGNTATCSISLTLLDVTPPTAVCQPVTVYLDANGTATLDCEDIDGGSSDACGDVTFTCVGQTVYTCADVDTPRTVILIVTDSSGNSSTCTATVTVVDTVAPEITCPGTITVTAPSGQCSTAVTYTVTTEDACGSTVTSVTPPSGSIFGLGCTTVTAVATDASGNTASCSFSVCVQGTGIIEIHNVPADISRRCDQSIPPPPPIVPCPSGNNGSGHCGSGHGSGHGSGWGWGWGSGWGNHGSNHGSGHGSGNHGSNHGSGHGSNCGSGHHGSGHGSNCGSGHGSGNNGSGHNNGIYATSECGPCPTVTYSETIVPGNCPNNYTIVRTWTATDTYGNSVSESQTITVYDDRDPVINCPNNITVYTAPGATCKVVNFNVTATDNCSTPTVTSTPASGTCFPVGDTWVTSTATDACGNTKSCTFRVRVIYVPLQYCGAEGENSCYEWIKRVALSNLDNWSGNDGGYQNYTNYSATVARGNTYTVTLRAGYSGSTYTEYWRVYSDWNRDGDFTDAGELSLSVSGQNTVTGSITVPVGATLGNTRMRVIMSRNGYVSNPCCSFARGEVEDYTLNIIGGSARAYLEPSGQSEEDAIANQKVVGLETVNIYPVPTADEINVDFISANTGRVSVQVIALDGKVVIEKDQEVQQHQNTISLNVSELSAGTYYVKIHNGSEFLLEKFVKQ